MSTIDQKIMLIEQNRPTRGLISGNRRGTYQVMQHNILHHACLSSPSSAAIFASRSPSSFFFLSTESMIAFSLIIVALLSSCEPAVTNVDLIVLLMSCHLLEIQSFLQTILCVVWHLLFLPKDAVVGNMAQCIQWSKTPRVYSRGA